MAEEIKKDNPKIEEAHNDPNAPTSAVGEAQALIELKKQVDELSKRNLDLEKAKKQYYDKIINNNAAPEVVEPQRRAKSDVIKEMLDISHKGGTNLDYVKLACELDDIVIEETGRSVFLPVNDMESPKADELETARRTRQLFDYAIEASDNDPQAFNMILSKHIVNPKVHSTPKKYR